MDQHNPFEEWILQDEALDEAQERALIQHTASCGRCRQLRLNWQQTRQQIKTTPVLSPAAGFSQRWQSNLAARQARQKAQVRRFFKYLIGINLFSLLGLIVTFILGTAPLDVVSGLLHTSVSAFLYIRQAQSLVLGLFHSVPLFVPIVCWILVSTGFCLVVVTWGFSMWRYFYKGVNAK